MVGPPKTISLTPFTGAGTISAPASRVGAPSLCVRACSDMRYVADYLPWWEQGRFARRYEVRGYGFPFRLDGWDEGWYECAGEDFTFDAGARERYGEWRDWLAQSVMGMDAAGVARQYKKLAQCPFAKLIAFSDHEGAIGPESSTRLAADFSRYGMDLLTGAPSWKIDLYRNFAQAFEIAARDGFVLFG